MVRYYLCACRCVRRFVVHSTNRRIYNNIHQVCSNNVVNKRQAFPDIRQYLHKLYHQQEVYNKYG